jgi:hypothetical protein
LSPNARNRRVSPVVVYFGDRLLPELIAGTQPCRREPLFLLRVFGRLPVTDSGDALEGRRPKSLRGGNRGEFAPAVVSVYGDLAPM